MEKPDDLTERQWQMLLAASDPKETRLPPLRKLAESQKMYLYGVQRHIHALVKKGYIERSSSGTQGYSYYKLTPRTVGVMRGVKSNLTQED